MPDAEQQTKIFPLYNRGVVSKKDPALLRDGELIEASNIVSLQEGNITSRLGTKILGTMAVNLKPVHTISKFTLNSQTFAISGATNANPIEISTDNPHGWQSGFQIGILGVNGNTAANSVSGSPWAITVTGPSTFTIPVAGSGAYTNGGQATLADGDASIRYIGEGGNIWRTLNNYTNFTKVAQNVMGSFDPFNRWSQISYSAGSTGNPFSYFCCAGAMLKDQGNAPFGTLRTWGITRALAAAGAVNAEGTSKAVTGFTFGSVAGTALMYQLAVAGHGFSTGDTIVVSGILDVDGTLSTANGTWNVIVVDANNIILSNSVYAGTYDSGGAAILAGPDSYQPAASPFDYVYCLRDPSTGNQGNPSPFMQDQLAVQSQNGVITVTVWGSPDPKISGSQSIAVYRRGGIYTDGIFRLIGYAVNPGVDGTGKPLSVTVTDNNPDINLLYAPQVEFDNDAPVTSALRFPISATISGGGFAPGWRTVTLSQPIVGLLTVGSTIIVGPASSQETCTIAALPYNSVAANTTCLLYFQQSHDNGEPAIISSVTSQPCPLGITAFDSQFLAGDANNPSTLYKSKTGQPESFPTIDALGNSNVILVGSPSNPIMNLTAFRGNILLLNQINISEVSVFQGVMAGPYNTPSDRGLQARWGFCNTGTVVYYLSNDGIYAWDGSRSTKKTEAIDPAFKGIAIGGRNPIAPVSFDANDLLYARMEFYHNQLYFMYSSGGGLNNMHVLRYDVIYDRWEPESYVGLYGVISEIFVEKDTDAFIISRYNIVGNRISRNGEFGTLGSTDDFSSSDGLNGASIPYLFRTPFFSLEESNRIKLVQDIFIELYNQDEVSVRVFYDYQNNPDPLDQFTIPASPSTGGVITGMAASGTLMNVLSVGHNLIDGNRVLIVDVHGVPANGEWAVSVVDANHFTLNGSTFSGLYTFGGSFSLVQRRQVTFPLQITGNPPISSGKEAFSVSVEISGSSTMTNVFYALGVRFFDRDAIQQGITTDWMNLGSNNDKRLYQLMIEHNTGGVDVTVQMDIRYGVNGTSQSDNVATFVLNSTDKTTVSLPISEFNFPGRVTICKSVRLRPQYTRKSNFRIFFKPSFEAEVLPPDVILFTKLETLGWPCGKIARNLVIDIDTGGVDCEVTAVADNNNIQVFTINSTVNDRERHLPFDSVSPLTGQAPIGRLWRLLTAHGLNGKAQIFSWTIDYTKDACDVDFFDTWELALGYKGWKIYKQFWLDYLCPEEITVTLIVDGGRVLYAQNLPAQATRTPARFYIPDSAPGTPAILNKSRTVRVQVSCAADSTFRIYHESSGIEWAACGSDQRGNYQQMPLSEATKFTA